MGAIGGCLGFLVLIAVFLAIWSIWRYNNLVSLKYQVANAWKQIDVQLKRRHDLIPNLIGSVRGEMQFEQDTLEKVIAARNSAVAARGVAETAEKENVLTQTLSRLFALAENYPNLKANESVKALMEELTSTENKIGFARQFYNDIATRFNIAQQVFPDSLRSAATKDLLRRLKHQSRSFAEPALSEAEGLRMTRRSEGIAAREE